MDLESFGQILGIKTFTYAGSSDEIHVKTTLGSISGEQQIQIEIADGFSGVVELHLSGIDMGDNKVDYVYYLKTSKSYLYSDLDRDGDVDGKDIHSLILKLQSGDTELTIEETGLNFGDIY